MSDAGNDTPTGTYCQPQDVRLALTPDGNPADLSSAAGLDDNTIQGAITDATTEVEARLAGRYTIPFVPPVPAVVAQVTVGIAAYLATMVFRRGAPINPTDTVYLRYARAQSLLRDLGSGAAVIDIGGPPGAEPASTFATVINPYQGHMFGPEDFRLGYAGAWRDGWSGQGW